MTHQSEVKAMVEECFNALLIFPFEDFVTNQFYRLHWALRMLESAIERPELDDTTRQLINTAKFLITEAIEDLKHLDIEKVYAPTPDDRKQR